MALRNPDTQLPSEALFLDRLEQAVHLAKRRRGQVAVLILPLAQLSEDAARIRKTAEHISRRLRSSDTVTHIDGQGYRVLLNDVEDRAAAWAVAEELLLSLTHQDADDDATPLRLSEDYSLLLYPDDAEDSASLRELLSA